MWQVGDGDRDGEAVRLLTQSLSLYGNWLAETRSETPTVIMEQYLEKVSEARHCVTVCQKKVPYSFFGGWGKCHAVAVSFWGGRGGEANVMLLQCHFWGGGGGGKCHAAAVSCLGGGGGGGK